MQKEILYSKAVTPSDSVDIDQCRALICAVAGDVKVTYSNGAVDTVYLVAGHWHFMRVKRVWSNGTAATGICAGY